MRNGHIEGRNQKIPTVFKHLLKMNIRPTGRKLVELGRHLVQPLRGHGETRERTLLFIGYLLASRGQLCS